LAQINAQVALVLNTAVPAVPTVDSVDEVVKDANTLRADTTTLKADTTTLKADTTTLKVDTTTLKADTTTLKADTNTLKADTTTLKGTNTFYILPLQNPKYASLFRTANSYADVLNINGNGYLISIAGQCDHSADACLRIKITLDGVVLVNDFNFVQNIVAAGNISYNSITLLWKFDTSCRVESLSTNGTTVTVCEALYTLV
jgi:hypothetical protein